jgi:hypothetical protein
MIYLCICNDVDEETVTIVLLKLHALNLSRHGISLSVFALSVLLQSSALKT